MSAMTTRRPRRAAPAIPLASVLTSALVGALLGTALIAVAPAESATRKRTTTTVRRVVRPATTRPPVVPLAPTTVAAPAPTAAPTTAPTTAPATTTTTAPAAPPFTVRPVLNVTVGRGTSATITEVLTYSPGFRGDLRWELPPAFDGITVSVSPNPGRNLAEITVRTAATTTPGAVPFPLVVSGGGISRNVTVVVTVTDTAPPAAVTGLTAAQQWAATIDGVGTVLRGSSAATTLRITRGNGFTGRLTASVGSAPAGITLGLSENPVGDTATLVVNVATTVAPGTYQVAIVLASGSVSSTLVFAVVVV